MWIIWFILFGLVVGALARLAVPGPDPMPIWATIALGLAGSVLGGFIFRVLFNTGIGFLGCFIFAVLLLMGYRHYIQKRPIWGPGARTPPG